MKRACLESTLLSNTKLLRLWFQKLLQNFSLLLSFWRVNTFSVLPLRLSLQQMDAGVWTVGSQRWVIVIAALRAEGCVPVMKCYDGEDRYLWPARIRVTAEQKLHFSAIAQKHSLHSFSSPIASLGLSLSLSLSLTCRHTLLAALENTHALKDTHAHFLSLRLCIRQAVEEVYIQAWPRGSRWIDEVPF